MKKALMLWLAPVFPLCLTACEKQVVVERIPVPAKWLTCAPQPGPPADNTDRAVAGFIVDLVAAGQDCRDTVAAIRDWSKAP